MKELSIEEKATRYDDLLVKLQKAKVDDNVCDDRYCCVIDDIVPELKESEDEKMRAMAIKAVYAPEAQSCIKSWGINPDDVIAWLEKQGEQPQGKSALEAIKEEKVDNQNCAKPDNKVVCPNDAWSKHIKYNPNSPSIIKESAWSEEDETKLNDAIDACKAQYGNMSYTADWLKSLKDRVQPNPAWGEEDRRMLIGLIDELDAIMDKATPNEISVYSKYTNWLKSLRPQSKTHYWTENEIKFAISDYIGGAESYEKMVEKLRCLKPQNRWRPSEEMLEALYKAIPENTMAISEDEMLLDKLYQGLKYGRVLSNK